MKNKKITESIKLITKYKECQESLLETVKQDEKVGLFTWQVDIEELKHNIKIFNFIIEQLKKQDR